MYTGWNIIANSINDIYKLLGAYYLLDFAKQRHLGLGTY